MAYREVYRMEVLEIIRRWQLGESRRSIAWGSAARCYWPTSDYRRVRLWDTLCQLAFALD